MDDLNLKIDDLTNMQKYLNFIKSIKQKITDIIKYQAADMIKQTYMSHFFRGPVETYILNSIYKTNIHQTNIHQMSKENILTALNGNEFIKACQEKWDEIIKSTWIDIAQNKQKAADVGKIFEKKRQDRLAAAAADVKRLADTAAAADAKRLAEEQQRLDDEAAEQQRLDDAKQLADAAAGQKQKVNRSLFDADERRRKLAAENKKKIEDTSKKNADKSTAAKNRRDFENEKKIQQSRDALNVSAIPHFNVKKSKGGSSKTKKTHKNIEKNITRKKTYKPA